MIVICFIHFGEYLRNQEFTWPGNDCFTRGSEGSGKNVVYANIRSWRYWFNREDIHFRYCFEQYGPWSYRNIVFVAEFASYIYLLK